MEHYTRLSKQERHLIEIGIRARKSMGQIAKSIGRPTKTVSVEIRRNGGYLGYYAVQAHYERNKSNRAGYSKIDENIQLQEYIRNKLVEKWSPEVIAGRWNMENPESTISHETIYAWVYKQPNNLYLSLPRKKKARGKKPQRLRSKIPNRTPIDQRPEYINSRSDFGHFEGDLVFQQGNSSQNILSLVERKSRMVFLVKNQSKHSNVVIGAVKGVKSRTPMKTITFDNGSEFASHSELGIDTYFCNPGSPWQKGAIENINGIVRRYIDYRADINSISQDMLDSVAHSINNKPRKILGFLTPIEVASNLYKKKLDSVTLYS